MVDPVKKIFQLILFLIRIYVKKWIISIFFLQLFTREFSFWFSLIYYKMQPHLKKVEACCLPLPRV